MWNTMHGDGDKKSGGERDEPIEQGDLLGNFVRRTDNDFQGIKDPRLIGKDMPEDDEDETDEDEAER